MTNATTWFQLGVIGDATWATRSGALYVSPVGDAKRHLYGAGPEIAHGLGAFLYAPACGGLLDVDSNNSTTLGLIRVTIVTMPSAVPGGTDSMLIAATIMQQTRWV